MNRSIFKLPGLLAAAMLVVQVPVCACSEASHSADATEVSRCCRQDVSVSQNGDHKSGHRHGSHQPTSEGHHCPCPESCLCASENSQTAIVVDAVTAGSIDRQARHWLGETSVLLVALPASPEAMRHHASSAGSAIDAGIFAQENPCALLSRWLL